MTTRHPPQQWPQPPKGEQYAARRAPERPVLPPIENGVRGAPNRTRLTDRPVTYSYPDERGKGLKAFLHGGAETGAGLIGTSIRAALTKLMGLG